MQRAKHTGARGSRPWENDTRFELQAASFEENSLHLVVLLEPRRSRLVIQSSYAHRFCFSACSSAFVTAYFQCGQCLRRQGQRISPVFQRCNMEHRRSAARWHLHLDACNAHISLRAARPGPMDPRALRHPLLLYRFHRATHRVPWHINDDGSVE